MRTRLLVTALATLAAGLAVPYSQAANTYPLPDNSEWTSVYFPSRDGTSLHGDLLKPKGGCPAGGCPVVVSIGPYFGHGQQGIPTPTPTYTGPSNRFYDFINKKFGDKGNIFDQGYSWLQVDSRGYGVSGGCSDYGGPGEQSDVAAAVEWAGTQPWSSGHVGMWGKSYDGWTQVMGLAMNPPHLDAVVVESPLIEGYGIGYVNGVHHSASWYVTTSLYMLYDYTPNGLDQTDTQAVVNAAGGAATDPCWAKQQAIIAAGWDHNLEYWRQRDLRSSAGRNDDVAVLWSHGFNDVNTKPDQIFGVYGPLNNQPKSNHRAWFGQWDHQRAYDVPQIGRDGFAEEALDWLDHYLKGKPFAYDVNEKNVVEIQDNEGNWRTEAVYPPSDVTMVPLPIRDASYTDNGLVSSGSYWTFSQPLPYDIRVAGEPTVTLTPTFTGAFANVIAVLSDYDPATNKAVELSRGAYRIGTSGQPITFTLQPRDHRLRAGHRIAIQITNAHPEFTPHSSGATVSITKGSVSVPALTFSRISNLKGVKAPASSYSVTPAAGSVASSSVEMTLPAAAVTPDAATREALQPTVNTPGGKR